MMCQATAFKHSGCPSVDVNLSFPSFSFCSSPEFVGIVTPKLYVPRAQATPDIAPPAVYCISIDPITETSFGSASLIGKFSLGSRASGASGSGDPGCEDGLYRLKYALRIPCQLTGLNGSYPIKQMGEEVGKLIFNVVSCSLNIEAYATCAGGVISDTCIDRHIGNVPLDIPIIATGYDNVFNIVSDNCNLYGSIRLRKQHASAEFCGEIDIARVSSYWSGWYVPHIENCNLVGLSVHIRIPTPEWFGFTFYNTQTSELIVSKIDDTYNIRWKSLKLFTGPTGDQGPTGSYFGCVDIHGNRYTCKVTGQTGSTGPTGFTGATGSVGSLYLVYGMTGPTGTAYYAYSCHNPDAYVSSYINLQGIRSLDIRLTGMYSNTVILVENCEQEVVVHKDNTSETIDALPVVCNIETDYTDFIGTC